MLPKTLKDRIGNSVGEITEIKWGVMQFMIQTAVLPHVMQMLTNLQGYKISETDSHVEGYQVFRLEKPHNYNCARIDFPKIIQGWINSHLDDQERSMELCEKHMEWYWWEDRCPVCADEADEQAALRNALSGEPADPFYPCTKCGGRIFYEDGFCRTCDPDYLMQ